MMKNQSMKKQWLSSIAMGIAVAMLASRVMAGDAAYNNAVLSEPSLFRYWTFDGFDDGAVQRFRDLMAERLSDLEGSAEDLD